ncbi:EAL domain-containing protein [Azohydromonas australica]|uniref:EAL domain-containing protein n=1 Tax=Azohydromonas australica TaxID=364039 RepID=UPI000407B934|nr:EAL domain-containing protein [Azohydromonas australica]
MFNSPCASISLARVRNLGLLSVGAALCMLALIGHFLWQSRQHAVETAELETRNLVEIVESRVTAEFKLVDGLLAHAAQDIPYTALKGSNLEAGGKSWMRNLDALLDAFSAVTHLHVFDENGLMLYSTGKDPAINISGSPVFLRLREHADMQSDFSGLHYLKSTGKWGIVQVRALRGPDGRFLGLISALLSLDGLAKVFGDIDMGQGGQILLRSSRDGELVLRVPRHDESPSSQPLPPEHPVRQRIEAGERLGSVAYAADGGGVRHIGTFKQLERHPFHVQVDLDEAEYLGAWREQALLSFTLALLAAGALGAAILGLGRAQLRAGRALQQLRTSEQRLSEAQGIAQMGSWEYDHEAGELRWSDQMYRILEIPLRPSRDLLDQLRARVHPDDLERVSRSLENRRAGMDRDQEIEYRLRFGDGHVKHVHEAWTTHLGLDGTRLRCVGTLQDITDRKELDQAIERDRESLRALGKRLEDSRALLRKVIDDAPVLILLKDVQGRFLLANTALARLYGTTPQDLLGRNDADFNPNAEQVAAYARTNEEVLRSGTTQTVFEQSTDAATGEVRHYQSVKSPFTGPDGQPCVLVIATDITELKRTQMRLQASEQRMAYVLEATDDGIYDWYIAEDRVDHNDRWGAILGLRQVPQSHPVSLFVGLLHPADRAAVMARVQDTLEGRGPLRSEHRMLRADGQVVWVLDRGQVVERAGDGTPLRMAGSISDITARKEAEGRLALAASVFATAREGIVITDARYRIVDVNEAFTRITGYAREEVLGREPMSFKAERHEPAFFQAMGSDLRLRGFWEGEVWNRHKSGRDQAQMMTISAVRDGQQAVSHYVMLFSDITVAKENERLLRQFAHFDALTGLPNRVLLADRLGQAMAAAVRSQRSLALAYVDLDGFKAINDLHGHEAGDHVLLAVAERMKECLRGSDTIARLGGDEFVAVLTDLPDQPAVLPVVQRLLRRIAEPVGLAGAELHVSGSIGVTFFPQPTKIDADQLLRQADQAMYQAKLAGKNRHHVFDVHQHASLQGRYEQIERIRQALQQGELELHYQPKVHMRKGQVLGVEALLRWRHPQRGLVPPMSFLPLIEQHPLEIDVGWWVIRTALEQARSWRAQGLHLPVSVNVTGYHLQQPDFAARLQQALQAHPDLPPRCLELEVLESSALDDIGQASSVIQHCQRIGVHVALDDFGTGYSTLTHLKRLPARVLKIDRSFVQNMLYDTGDLTILEGVIGLANSFLRDLVAEGVESVAHGRMLLQLGCEVGQGYAIARPMPGPDFAAWLQSWRPDPSWACTAPLPLGLKPALYALVEHRAWMRGWRAHCAGEDGTGPVLDASACQFSHWMRSPAADDALRQARGELLTLHRQLHDAALECERLRAADDPAQSQARAREVEALHERLELLLLALLETVPAEEGDAAAALPAPN